MRKVLIRGFVLLTVLAMLLSLWPAAVLAQLPAPEDKLPTLARPRHFKPIDEPNPLDAKRLQQRELLLTQGRTAEAAALAKTGSDTLLVILVEFAGTDTATWNPGDTWDPIGDPAEVDFEDYGDCTNVISQTQTFTYTGPLHNQLIKPPNRDHPAYNSFWTADFGQEHYWNMLFGDGAYSQYTLEDGQVVTIDLRGYSMRQFYEEQSKGMYTVEGDVIGWVQVPHSEAWYGADACPGARSAGYSPIADGYFPNGGSARSLGKDAVDAAVAAYPNFDWAKYDQNGDGVLDRVMFVHAGYGEEETPPLLTESGVGEMAVWSVSTAVYPDYPIGTTGLKLGPFVIMPENGTTGVFAHEFAHNLGTMDLYAYNPGETSPGFWTLMADDWGGGWPSAAVPPGLDPWHKYMLGWNDPVVLSTMSPEAEVTLGQACMPPAGSADSVVVNLPAQIEQPIPPAGGEYMWWSGKSNWLDSKLTLAAPLDLSTATTVTLNFNTVYDTEEGWDFGFVQVSTDGGTTWTSLPGTTTTDEHDPDCFFIPEMPGYTGFSGEWLDEEVDLSAYKGKNNVLLRFRYETDPAVLGLGWYLDDISITADGEVIFSDDVEEPTPQWVVENWTRTDGYAVYPHYYIAEWRNSCGFDAGLVSGRYNIKDFGMLLWYRNFKYSDNEVFNYLADPPAFGAKGACMVVDAHFEPWRSSTSEYVNEVANLDGRVQMRDACFGLRPTQSFSVSPRWRKDNPDEEFGSRPAASVFDDSLGWYPGLEYAQRGPDDARIQWFTKHWDASVVIPALGDYGVAPPEYPEGEPLRFGGEAYPGGRSAWWWYSAGVGYGGSTGNPGANAYGVHIAVVEEASDLSWGKVRIWNNTDTFHGWMKVDKMRAAPGDVLSYEVYIKDATETRVLTTVDIPIPKGTTLVEGSLSGGQYVADSSDPELVGQGHVIWGGKAGGKVLHTPDVHITYQVRIRPDMKGAIANEALVKIQGRPTYKLAAVTHLPQVSATLAAPTVAGVNSPIRYTIAVKNESAVALDNVDVAINWTGPAILTPPYRSRWVVPTLAAGATWTQEFTLRTDFTATGQVVTTVTVTHPWIRTATASATTTIVR